MKLYYNNRFQCSGAGDDVKKRIKHICLCAKMVTQKEAENLFALAMKALFPCGVMCPGEIRLQSCRRFACGTNAGDPVYEGTFRITEN